MGFTDSNRKVAEGVAGMAVTSALFYFGNGMEPVWPLVWLACIPLLWFALRSPWWGAASAAIIAMLLGNLNLWTYLTKTLGLPPLAWVGIFSTVAFVFAAAVLLFRALVLRGAVWSGLIALPSVWVAMEYLRNLTTPNGSAGSLAYSQLKFLPFLQFASITGPWGMTFVLLMVPSAIAIWLHLRSTRKRTANRVVAFALGVLACILAFGAARLTQHSKTSVRVGLIASDLKENDTVVDPGSETERLFRSYANAADDLMRRGANAIVIPEKLGVTLEGKSSKTDAILQSLADRTGATIVAGVVHVDGSLKFNEARVYTRGEPVQRYDKEHLLPPFESPLKPGTTLTTLRGHQDVWGVAICKDMDFASPSRRYGQLGVGLLLVPGWDFVKDRSWHGHIAIMRGVEEGFSIARSAKNGFMTASDDRGRILGEERSDAAPFATLLVDVPTEHHWTVYQALGDWFAWVALALSVLTVARALRPQAVPESAPSASPQPQVP